MLLSRSSDSCYDYVHFAGCMNPKIILIVLLSALTVSCRTLPEVNRSSDISVKLHPITYSPLIDSVTNPWLIMDVSQRDPFPEGAMGSPRGISFPNGLTPELEKWRDKYTAQVDLIAEIRNISSHDLRLFEEWNSWGYCNLKFVFTDGFHEFWVTKQPGLWYRNFSSFHTLAPGKSLQIPVALVGHIWTGLDVVNTNASHIVSVRALYEQYQTPMFGVSKYVWRGSVSSPLYPAAKLLPRFGFLKSESHEAKEIEMTPVDVPPVDRAIPDAIKIKIE